MTTTLGTGCGCGCSSTSGMDATPSAAGERTRFYPRQLVSAPDFTQDQMYFREKAKRHNRLLHGWGIVCGAEVKVSEKPGCVDVNVGYILGPYGDEILIDEVVTVDLSARNADGDVANGCDPPDPWCAELRVTPPADQPVYLAIAYAEFPCRPVQTATSVCGCGCQESSCEYTRWRDSYRIRVLDSLPETYAAKMYPPGPAVALRCRSDFATTNAYLARELQVDAPAEQPEQSGCECPSCGPCPSSPWVILADITVSGENIKIDCDAHRRYVASFRDFYYTCVRTSAPAVTLADVFTRTALDRLRAEVRDIPAAVVSQPARNLSVSVAANSPLAKRIESLTVADVAMTSRDAFVANMVTGASASTRAGLAEKAGAIWEKAVAAKQLAEGHR